MIDYSLLGLNNYLQPINAPSSAAGQISSFAFDSNNERGAITNTFLQNLAVTSAKIQDASITNAKIGTAAISDANIGTLSFGVISGGTATFGGTANGDGLVEVLSEAGGTIVELNKDGVTINDGNMTFKNAGGTTIMDGTGLVSAANFIFGNADNSTSRTTGTSVYTDLVGGSVTTSSFSRDTNVLILYTVRPALYDNTNFPDPFYGAFNLSVDGTVQPDYGTFYSSVEDSAISAVYPFSRQYTLTATGIKSLSSGTHVLKLQFKTGAPLMYCYQSNITYLVLGS